MWFEDMFMHKELNPKIVHIIDTEVELPFCSYDWTDIDKLIANCDFNGVVIGNKEALWIIISRYIEEKME